jgi:hypothetical protein
MDKKQFLKKGVACLVIGGLSAYVTHQLLKQYKHVMKQVKEIEIFDEIFEKSFANVIYTVVYSILNDFDANIQFEQHDEMLIAYIHLDKYKSTNESVFALQDELVSRLKDNYPNEFIIDVMRVDERRLKISAFPLYFTRLQD